MSAPESTKGTTERCCVSPHSLMHFHITYAKKLETDPDLIRTVRRASLATTGLYLHASPFHSSAMDLGL